MYVCQRKTKIDVERQDGSKDDANERSRKSLSVLGQGNGNPKRVERDRNRVGVVVEKTQNGRNVVDLLWDQRNGT